MDRSFLARNEILVNLKICNLDNTSELIFTRVAISEEIRKAS